MIVEAEGERGEMKKTVVVFCALLVLVFSGCGEDETAPSPAATATLRPEATATPVLTATPTPALTTTPTPALTPTPVATPTITPVATSTPALTPGTTPAPTPVITVTPTPAPVTLSLEISAPEDESVVSADTITVRGTTAPGAVVSVSVDGILEVTIADVGGHFSAVVALQEGPNFIEVVASDLEGNEVTEVLMVISDL